MQHQAKRKAYVKRKALSWVRELPLSEKRSMVDSWKAYAAKQQELIETPPDIQAAISDVAAEEQHPIEWSPDELAAFAEAAGQQRLEFAGEDKRANVRARTYRKMADEVLPAYPHREDLAQRAQRLRDARRHGTTRYSRELKRFITIWDAKADDPLLCPDDAREEAMRVQSRIVPAIMKVLQENPNARVYSAVFTKPTVAPGELSKAQRANYKSLIALVRKCKRDGSLPLLGAYAVMESPLTWDRKWHAHINVILVTQGWLDWSKVRELWRANVHLSTVGGRSARERYRIAGRPTEAQLKGALRELIKYAVRAVPEKSAAKAAIAGDDDRPPPPAMTQWTPAEWVEYLDAHKRFRRSRGYGCLFKVDAPEKTTDLASFSETVGTIDFDGERFVRRYPLLDSILGDKSSTVEVRKWHIEALRKLLYHPGHSERVRDALLTIKKLYGPVSLAVE